MQCWRESSKSLKIIETAKERFSHESVLQVAHRWSRTLPQPSENAQERLQRKQISKNCRTDLEMESNQSIDGKQCTGSHSQEANHSPNGRDVYTAITVHVKKGRVGNMVVGIGGTLVSPPLSVDQVKHYFRDVQGFPEIDELIDSIQNGVPVNSTATNLDPTRALQYGNDSRV